jgi:formate/nitrite transporter
MPGRSEIFKKSVLAGALIAIGALFSIRAATYGPVVQGLCFSVGLFGVLCTGAMLFTGSMLAMETVWRKETTISDVAVMWATLWAFNLAGAVTVALMAFDMGFDATTVAQAKAALPWHELLVRAVLCNVLVCLAVWTYKETQSSGWVRNRGASLVLDALASCLLPVACFVACGFEHSVADMLYMPLGMMQGAVSPLDVIRVLLLATAGNLVGGIGFAWMVRK